MPSSRGSSWFRDRTCISCVSCIAEGFFTHWATWNDVLTTLYFSEEPPKHSLFLLPQKNHTFLRLECLMLLQTDRPTYSLLFLVTVFRLGHISAMQLVSRLPAGMLRFQQLPNFQFWEAWFSPRAPLPHYNRHSEAVRTRTSEWGTE